MRTLVNLISGKEFERYQSGLKARFGGHGYSYKYVVGNGENYLSIKFDTNKFLGAVKVFENGRLDLRVSDKYSGEDLLRETHNIKSADQFFDLYPKVFIYVRDN